MHYNPNTVSEYRVFMILMNFSSKTIKTYLKIAD